MWACLLVCVRRGGDFGGEDDALLWGADGGQCWDIHPIAALCLVGGRGDAVRTEDCLGAECYRTCKVVGGLGFGDESTDLMQICSVGGF